MNQSDLPTTGLDHPARGFGPRTTSRAGLASSDDFMMGLSGRGDRDRLGVLMEPSGT